jgi:hypothetical protein
LNLLKTKWKIIEKKNKNLSIIKPIKYSIL